MSCEFAKHIECTGGNCGKCGWNPAVSEKRKKKIKSGKMDFLNLGERLKNYKANVIATCYDVLAGKIGGNVTGDDLQLLSVGVSTCLLADELKRIDKVLRRIERKNNGG